MGMTENEAKEYGENYLRDLTVAVCKVEEKHKNFVRMAIQALSEIQQYRAIGTVEKLLQLQHDYWYLNEMCKEYSAIGTVEDIQLIFSLCKDLERIVKKYEAIGTIEEFKALKEKNTDIEKIIESIKQLPTQDFMGVLHIPRTATINRIKRGGNCELPEV